MSVSDPGLQDPDPGFTIPGRNPGDLQPASLLRRDLAEVPFGDLSGPRKVPGEVPGPKNRPKLALFRANLGRFLAFFGGLRVPETSERSGAKPFRLLGYIPLVWGIPPA